VGIVVTPARVAGTFDRVAVAAGRPVGVPFVAAFPAAWLDARVAASMDCVGAAGEVGMGLAGKDDRLQANMSIQASSMITERRN